MVVVVGGRVVVVVVVEVAGATLAFVGGGGFEWLLSLVHAAKESVVANTIAPAAR